MKKFLLIIFLSLYLPFEVEEQLSITELKEEAQLFILNQSYIDAISNYEKIYDMQSLIFGPNHKNLSETLIILGDLYYKVNDELNTIRCFQESIHIMHYNSLVSDQLFITPLEYLYEVYLSNDQLDLSEHISSRLEYLYSLDTLSYENTNWTHALKSDLSTPSVDTNIFFESDSVLLISPYDYIDSSKYYIQNENFQKSISFLSNAFIEGSDLFDYGFYNNLFASFSDLELAQLSDFFQAAKYSDNQDTQASAYFYLSLISFQLGNNNLSLSYIHEFLRLMPDDFIGFIILANNYYSQSDYISALSEYQKILWVDPNNDLALVQQGLCFYHLGYYSEAQSNFKIVLSNNPSDYNSLYYSGLIEYENNNFSECIKFFLELLQYDSKNYEIYNYLGDSYYQLDNLKLALSAYKQSVSLNAYDPKIYYKIGIIYEQLLNINEAINNYNQAINMDNNDIDLLYRLANILYQDNQLKKSLEYFRRYIAYKPKDIEIIEILADVLYKLNRLPEAIDNYKRLIDLNQHKFKYYNHIAKAYWELGDYIQSDYYYQTVLNYPEADEGEVFYYLGFIANQTKNYDLAINYFLDSKRCGYTNINLYYQLSYACIQMNNYVQIISILHEGLYYHPDDYNLLYDLGLSYYELGLYSESIDILNQYFIQNNTDLTAAYLMGVSYLKIKKYKTALYYLELIDGRSDYEILYYLGICNFHLKNYNKAIRLFKKSLIINPQNEYTVYALGQCYIEAENKRDAKRQLKSLMNLDSELFELLKVSFDSKFLD